MDQSRLGDHPAQLVEVPASRQTIQAVVPRSLQGVAAALVVGLGLRLLFLGSKSLWLDEALSIAHAVTPQEIFAGRFDHSHPPLYYILLHYWLQLGNSEFVMRLSSVLVGSIAIPLSYALASTLGNRQIARSMSWLVALSPLLVWYAQELRSYSLLLVLSLVVGLALVRLVARPHLAWWLLFIASMGASLYTHYAAVFLVAVQVALIALLYLQERATRAGVLAWLAAWPLVLLLYWPWLTAPGMSRFVELTLTSNLYPIDLLASRLSISTTQATGVIVVAGVVALLGVLMGGWWMIRQDRATWNRWAASPFVRYGLLLLFAAATLVWVVPRLYTIKKLVMHLWPYGLLVVAWVFPWRISNRLPLALLLGVSLAGSLVNVTLVPKDQWRETAAYLIAQSKADDAVWVAPHYHSVPLSYYLDHANAATSEPSTSPNPAQLPLEVQRVSPAMDESELAALLDEGQRVWLVYHAVDYRITDAQRRLEQWLTTHMQPVDEIHYHRIDATLYAPRP